MMEKFCSLKEEAIFQMLSFNFEKDCIQARISDTNIF